MLNCTTLVAATKKKKKKKRAASRQALHREFSQSAKQWDSSFVLMWRFVWCRRHGGGARSRSTSDWENISGLKWLRVGNNIKKTRVTDVMSHRWITQSAWVMPGGSAPECDRDLKGWFETVKNENAENYFCVCLSSSEPPSPFDHRPQMREKVHLMCILFCSVSPS